MREKLKFWRELQVEIREFRAEAKIAKVDTLHIVIDIIFVIHFLPTKTMLVIWFFVIFLVQWTKLML